MKEFYSTRNLMPEFDFCQKAGVDCKKIVDWHMHNLISASIVDLGIGYSYLINLWRYLLLSSPYSYVCTRIADCLNLIGVYIVIVTVLSIVKWNKNFISLQQDVDRICVKANLWAKEGKRGSEGETKISCVLCYSIPDGHSMDSQVKTSWHYTTSLIYKAKEFLQMFKYPSPKIS